MPDNEFKAKTYRNLKTAYGDDYPLTEEEFSKKFDSDTAFVSKTYRNLKTAYGDDYTLTEADFKKKVSTTKPTEPASSIGGENSSVGSNPSQPTYSVKPDEGPLRVGKTTTVNVGGKDFSVPEQKDLTSIEVNQTAQKLFKVASPITQSKVQAISDHPAMQGIVKNAGESAFENLSSKVVSGNEDILSAYINKLPEAEQNRLRGKKFTEEESFQILSDAYRPILEQSVVDLSILRERGVEDDFKTIDSKQKQIQTLSEGIQSDKSALVNLQATYLKQSGYENLSSQYKELNKQIQTKQTEIAPVLEKKASLESELERFTPLIKDGQFTGNKQEYDAYAQLMDQYKQVVDSAELNSFNKLIQKQNEITKSVNSIVTPEFKAQEQLLTDKLNGNIASIQSLQNDLGSFITPEKMEQMNLYKEALGVYNGINDKLQSTKGKLPELTQKEQYIDALNIAVTNNPILKTYDLASKAFGGFTDAVGSMISSVPKMAGGLSNEYTLSDKAAESISDFFAPKALTTESTTAGKGSNFYKPFYDGETDKINWSSLPDEIANQIGAFAVLAGTGTLGGMAKMSDAVSIVLPGAMLSYNDAYKTGQEIYGNDALSATAYASASSLITGITELIMPDRDILTGGMVDGLAKNYVKNYIKNGKQYAIKESMLSLTEMMGKEVGEEFADRWKDVLLKGVVNVTGGDTEYDIPTINEQLSIAASTAALTGVGGAFGQMGKGKKARKLAVYEAAQNYPETLTMLNNMQVDGKEADRMEEIKTEVSDMFMALKQVPANLSAPKRIAIAEKLNTVKAIEDAMASGIAPIIADKMKESIKQIGNDIQTIIEDPEYDKQFAQEVNQEVASTPQTDVVDKTKTITEHLPKGGELKGVTEIDVSENGEEVSYGTKTRKTSITVKGLSAEEIKQEIKFEKQVLERSKRDAANFNEDEIRSAKGMTRQEKEDAIKMHKQSLINNEQVEKIVIPFYEKHLEIVEQSLKETPQAGSVGVGGEVKQKELENKVEEINKKRQALRGEDGVVPADKMGEWNELSKKLNEARAAATRGGSKSSILIKKKAESETSDPTILTKEEKAEAGDLIEQVIQGSKTVEEAVKKVRKLGYVFNLNDANLFALYLSDRYNPNAPQVGNNKSSFQEWVNGVQPKTVEQSLKETPTTSNQSEIEAKKADIERRRQEEILNRKGKTISQSEVERRFIEKRNSDKTQEKLTEGLNHTNGNINPEKRWIDKDDAIFQELVDLGVKPDSRGVIDNTAINKAFSENESRLKKEVNEDIKQEGLKRVTDEFRKQDDKQKFEEINAKYDAELKALEQQPTSSNQSEIPKVEEGSGGVGGDVEGKTFRDNYNRTFEVKGENAGILTLEDVDTGKVLRKKKSEVLSDFKEITEPDVVDQPIDPVANEEAVVDVEFTAKGGNKIVDSKGDPITLLHGTNDDKINFDEGTVFYATDNKQFADVYGENHLPVKITLKKPYDLTDSVDGVIKDANGEPMLDKEGKPYSINYIDESVVKDLKSRGFDGVRLGNESVVAFDKSQVKAVEQSLPTPEVKPNEPSIVTHIVPLLEQTPTAEGQTKEAITTNQNEKEANQKRVEKGLLTNESAKTEPVSEVEVQPTVDQKIEAANKRIDDIANHLKNVLKVDVTPKGTQKSGVDTEAIIDMIAQATKQFVAKGIKTQEALEQVIKSLRDAGMISGKEITKMRNAALSMVDEEFDKVWVTKNGKYELLRDSVGDFEVRDEKGKPVTKKSIRKKVISEYTQGKNLSRGEVANLDGVKEQDANRFIAENSNNPMQVAQAMSVSSEKMTEDELDFKNRMIADNIPWISRESFIKENDESNIIDEDGKFQEGAAIQLNYLRKNGMSVDAAAQMINDNAQLEKDTVTPEDVVNFILTYPKGKSQFYNQTNPDYMALAMRFKKLTGFNVTPEILESAKEYAETDEDFVGMEPAEKKDEMGSVAESKKKERRFTKQNRAASDISGEFKALITEDQKYYNSMPNSITLAEANFLIDTVGEDEAVRQIMNLDNPVPDAVRATVGQILLKRFEARGDYDAAIDMLEYLTKKATETGRFIQAFAMWSRLTPEGQLRVVQREMNKQVDKLIKKDKDKIKKAKSIINKARTEAINETLENVKGEKETVDEERNYGKSNKIVTKKEADEILKRLKEKKKAGKNLGFAMMPEQRAANDIADFEDKLKLAVYHIEASARSFAKFSKKMASSLGGDIKPYLKDLYLKAAKESGLDGTESEAEIDAYLGKEKAEHIAKKNAELEKRIAEKFEKATKLKSDKLFAEALGALMAHPERETLWKKYQKSAIARLKNIPVSEVTNDTDESPALKDFVDGLVMNIRQQMEENTPEKESTTREEKSAIAIIADAFKNIEKYREVWEATREEIAKKYADDPDALAKLDMYFGNVLDKPFSEKLLAKSVTELIGKNLDKLIELYYQGFDISTFENEVIEKIIYETGLDESVIRDYINDVKSEIGDRKSKSIEKIEDKKQKALDRIKNKLSSEKKAINKPVWGERRDKSIKSLINTLENRLFDKMSDKKTAIEEFAKRLNKNISTELKNEIQTKSKTDTENPIDLLAEVLKNFEKYQDVINETQKEIVEKYKDNPTALMQFDDALFKVGSTPFLSSLLSKSVKQGIKSLDINVAQIAKAHYTEYDATKRTLVDKLIADADLSLQQAEQLAAAIEKEFDRIMLEKKKSILDNMVKEKVIKKKKAPELESALSQMINLGAFDDAEFMKAWGEANDYPRLTQENIEQIRKLAEEVQKYEDGFEKYRAMENLLAYQEQIKGISLTELMTAVWYAHVLSGHNTQLVNAVSNLLNTIAEFVVQGLQNPGQSDFMLLGWFNGIKHGLLEGKEVLKTGYNPIRGKLEIPATLEVRSKLKKGKFSYSHAAKYVRRIMVATDVIFFEGLREMKAYQLAVSMAKTEADKLDPPYAIMQAATAKLNLTDRALQDAKDTADIEFAKKMADLKRSGVAGKEYDRIALMYERDRSRRVYEIIAQREADIIEKANDFARRGTYNYKPEGVLGTLANSVNMFTTKHPKLRFIVPFTNIIANVANEAINYTPLGFYKALNGGGIINRRDEFTTEQKADMLTKALLGTAAMATVLALTYDWDDDDDTPALLEITGNGTGDFNKNYNLQERGNWQSYSFRVWDAKEKKYGKWYRYQYSPLVVAFSMIGAVRDIEKYAPEKAGDKADLIMASAVIGARTFFDMSFVSTINDFLGVLLDPFDEFTMNRFAQSILNIGKGFLVANGLTQIAKEVEASTNEPMKYTPFVGSDPRTYISKWYQNMPIAKDALNDRVNALGEPITPITNKFISGEYFFERESNPLWDVIVDKKMLNLKVPPQKTVRAYDYSKKEMTPLTDDEYFYFCVERGTNIKNKIQLYIDKGLTNRLNPDKMTEFQKNATASALIKVEERRKDKIPFARGLFK